MILHEDKGAVQLPLPESRVLSHDAEGSGATVRRVVGGERRDQFFALLGREHAAGVCVELIYELPGRHDAMGRAVAEYSNQVQSNGTSYLTQDTLGSARVVTDKDGVAKSRHDYFPFGEKLQAGVCGRTTNQGYSQPDAVRQGFVGYESDDETGLNYAQARYHAPALGRFTSPDPTLLSVNAFNPQSWNRYTYVLNNPLLYVDPLGLWALNVETRYKTNEDGTYKLDDKGNKVIDRVIVTAVKTSDKDDGASLGKQLGLKGKDAEKFAAKIGGGDNIRLSEQGGNVGRVFSAVESGLTNQAKWEAKNSGKLDALAAKGEYGPSHSDCSRTACQIGLGQFLGLQVGTNVLDPLLDPDARAVAASDAAVGDIIRYAKQDNVATHFANFIFRNDDETPVAFSKGGTTGSYEFRTAASLQVPNYGTIRGRNSGESGYYRRR